MAKNYTVDALIASLKRRTSIPISQQTFTDDDLVEYLNDEMESTVVPILMDYREEYFVDYEDFDFDNTKPAIFPIPKRAVGEKLRDVVIVSVASNGDETLTNLPYLTTEQISNVGTYAGVSVSGSGTGFANQGFLIQGSNVRLYPQNGWGNSTLRLYYYTRPGRLVRTIQAGKITAINTITNTVTVDNALAEWVDGFIVAQVNGEQPFDYHKKDVAINTISGYNITFDDVSQLSIGDYICNPDESVFPQIPIEAHNLLLQAAKIVLLEAIDDDKNLKQAIEKYKAMEINYIKTASPRVDGQPKKVVSRNSVFYGTAGNWI